MPPTALQQHWARSRARRDTPGGIWLWLMTTDREERTMGAFQQPKSGYWIVGDYDENANQYKAPLTKIARRTMGGVHTMFARTADGIDRRLVYAYKDRNQALRKARELEDDTSWTLDRYEPPPTHRR